MYNKTGTTILCVGTKDNKVVLGLDRQSTANNTFSQTKKYKIHEFRVSSSVTGIPHSIKIYSAVAGYAAAHRHYQNAIVDCFEKPSTLGIGSSTNFFQTLSQKIAESWYKQTSLGVQMMVNSSLIVVYQKGEDIAFRKYDGVGSFETESRAYEATGSGGHLAIGSYCRALMNTEEGITKGKLDSTTAVSEVANAIRIAGSIDIFSGGKSRPEDIPMDVILIGTKLEEKLDSL